MESKADGGEVVIVRKMMREGEDIGCAEDGGSTILHLFGFTCSRSWKVASGARRSTTQDDTGPLLWTHGRRRFESYLQYNPILLFIFFGTYRQL